MKRILITGMSGTGKSTIIERLASMGRKAIDADSDVWSEWRIVPVAGDPTGDSAQPDWVWREDRIQRLLDTEDVDVLYISGCAANQGRFYDQLDHVVLLSAPTDVMMDRIARRTTNPFGKQADERAKILSDTRIVVPLLRARADIEIDTSTASIDAVTGTILALAQDA